MASQQAVQADTMVKRGGSLCCGLDEAGRGAFAGPLVAAAVSFPPGFQFVEVFPDLKFSDSKAMTPRQRAIAARRISEFAEVMKIELISVEEINTLGLGWANRTVFERLVRQVKADQYIVDGNLRLSNLGRRAARVRSVVRADQTEQAVSAASIIAKVYRDAIMDALHEQFPAYGWEHNKGYGTPEHIAALREYGPCPHHRRKFVATALARLAPRLPGFEG